MVTPVWHGSAALVSVLVLGLICVLVTYPDVQARLATSAQFPSPSSLSLCFHRHDFKVYKRMCDFILLLLMHISLKYSISNILELYKCYHALHIILQFAFSL